jgi:hypothetical protein
MASLDVTINFDTAKMRKLINNMEAAKRGEALAAAAKVIDRYIYSSLAPQIAGKTPVDTGALVNSLTSPEAPGAIYKGVISGSQFNLVYGTEMDAQMRYEYYGGGKTGSGSVPYPYFYPDEVEQEHGMMSYGLTVWRDILHTSALGNISKAIMRVLRR